MDHYALEKGRRYFCREETTGKGFTGMFHVDDEEMVAELYAFDEYLGGRFDDRLVVRLETNGIASLNDNITNGTSQNIDVRNQKQAWSKRVTSNSVVLGEDVWEASDPVRRVQFSIAHADELLRHSERFDAIADAEFGDLPDTVLFELAVAGMTIKVWYPAQGNFSFKRPVKIGVRYQIEFDEPRDLKTYVPDMLTVVQFASAAIGHGFVPSDIRVSRLTSADYLAAVAAKTKYREHSLHYIWPVDAPKETLWIGRSFAYARTDEELGAFLACLRDWTERDAAWRGATNMMMGALALQNILSGERLLTACNWLEEIPGADSEMAVSDEDIAAIAAAAAAEAGKRGHADYEPRVAGVIRSQLKKESNAERFARLHASVSARFGDDALGADIVPHLLKAMQYRGRVAHGHFQPADGEEFQAFTKSIYAMEALCYLLTIKDLPISDEGMRRALRQRIVLDYQRYPV